MPILMFSCVLWVAAGHVAAADLYAELNRLRAGDGRCTSSALPPLRPQAALEQAARHLARGNPLDRSLAAAGYRATRSSFFSISGEGAGARAAELLASRGDCKQIMDAGLTDVGIYVESGELRVVLAAPFAPAVEMSEQAAGRRVLELVNQARATPRVCGNRKFNAARPLRWNEQLAAAALAHAEDMARGTAIPDATAPIRRSASSVPAIVIAAPARTSRAGRCSRRLRWRAGSRARRIART